MSLIVTNYRDITNELKRHLAQPLQLLMKEMNGVAADRLR